MKTKHRLALLATCCAVTAVAGCASTDRPISRSSLDDKDLERAEAPSPTRLSQPVVPDERAFRKLDLGVNGAVALDKRRHFDTNIEAKENFSTLDENDLQTNPTEFLTQAPKHSQLSIFGSPDQTNNDFSRDGEEFQPQGLRLFTIRF